MHLPIKATKLGRKLYWESSARIRRLPDPRSTTETPEGVVTTVTGPALVEPRWGYVITGEGRLLEDSLRTNWNPAAAPWRFATPDPREFNRVRNRTLPEVREFDEVILLRDLYEWNYFHFYFDILGRLRVLDEACIPPSMPLLLGNYANELPFVRQIINTGDLGGRNWVIQGGSFIRANKVYYARINSGIVRRANSILDAMGMPWGPSGERRIFLNRALSNSRRIVNIDEVRRVLREHGFLEVDTSDMPLIEQVQTFQQARFLVAIHGAGITNIIYRRGSPLGVLELYADNYNSFEFRELAEGFGFGWAGLGGAPRPGTPQMADFTVDLSRLEEALTALITTRTDQRG